MNDEEIARRYSRRAGFQLVAYRQAALPLFRLTLRVQTLARRELPTILEFVLRAIASGLNTPEEIAGILGLEHELANASIASLVQTDCIVIGVVPGTRTQRLELTRKGNETLEQAIIVSPEEERVTVYVDGLTRQLALPSETVIRPREVGEAGLLELPAHPQRKPRLDEIGFPDLRKLLAEKWPPGENSGRDLTALLGIEASDRIFRDDVLLLVYRAVDGRETQFAIVVDGHLSEEHEASLRRANRVRQIKLVPDLVAPPSSQAPEFLTTDALKAAEATEETRNLHVEIDAAAQEVRDLRDQLRTVESPTERTLLREKLVAAEDKIDQLQASLDSIVVRQLEVYEHPRYLREALDTAKERVLIVSPWIRARVVDDDFVKQLAAALTRGVEVYIGYGLEGEGSRESAKDKDAIRRLQELAERFANFHFSYFGDTHAKVLVCDNRFVINTSFNWLSFRGDPDHPVFRDERGMYVGIPSQTENAFQFYAKRFR